MRAVAADVGERRRAVAVDLDPEHVEIGDLPQDLQITLGLGVEVEIEQQVDIGAGAVANGFEMGAQVTQNLLVDIEFRRERDAKSRPPSSRSPAIVHKDVGFERGKALLAHFGADRLDAVEAGDRRLVEGRMVDAPRRAVRPIDPNAVAYLAAEKRIARYPQRLRLGVEQRIFDGPEPLADDTARRRPGKTIELVINPLVVEDGPLDDRADAGRTETLVELAPADDPVIGRHLQEMVISPAGIAAKNLKALDSHRLTPSPVNPGPP